MYLNIDGDGRTTHPLSRGNEIEVDCPTPEKPVSDLDGMTPPQSNHIHTDVDQDKPSQFQLNTASVFRTGIE